MDRCLSENGILEAMDTWPKYGCMPDGRFIRLTKENEKDYVPYVHYDDMVKVVKGIPSLDVVPVVHAHWIRGGAEKWDEGIMNIMHCSNCKALFRYQGRKKNVNYCYRCGAKMDEVIRE